MSGPSFSTSFEVDRSPAEVFAAINDVRGWWSGEIDGKTDELGAEFTYRYEDVHYSKQRITELLPVRKVVWLALDSYLRFVENKTEWSGTQISFEIEPKDGHTDVRFTHTGLTPECECFDACSGAWSFYMNESLRNFISTGAAGQIRSTEHTSALVLGGRIDC